MSALALAAATGAQAAPARIADGKLFKVVTETDLQQLVLAEGHTVDELHPFEAPSVRGKTADGLFFVLIGTACDVGKIKGCQGTMMQVRYDQDETVTMDGVNKANIEEAAVGTWWDKEDKTVGFTRYVVMDDGVTWLNLRQNLRVLLDVQVSALKYVFPETDKAAE
ncbi:MAG: hypothetical protein Q8Q53_09690 [Novosphingobium sp.]|nr:hypothetical protein [Novosphingobium sp.]